MSCEVAPEPPIHRAARLGDAAEIRRLAAAGADLNERHAKGDHPRSLWGWTPLVTAAASTDGASSETLSLLCSLGADARIPAERGASAAHYVARLEPGVDGRVDSAEPARRLSVLLDEGVDPSHTGEIGREFCLLCAAAWYDDRRSIELLLERGALCSALASFPPSEAREAKRRCNGGPLLTAAGNGARESIAALLEAGADVDQRDVRNATPLARAKDRGTVLALLAAGADPDARVDDGVDVLTSLFGAGTWTRPFEAGRLDAAIALVEAGVDPIRARGDTDSRLYVLAARGARDAVEYLLGLGVRPCADSNRGRTPLHGAAAGAPWGCRCPDARIPRLLADAGNPPEARDADGRTPLHLAARATLGTAEMIEALVEIGATVEVRDARGRTPLDLALLHGRTEVVEVLLKAGARLESSAATLAILEARADPAPGTIFDSRGRLASRMAERDPIRDRRLLDRLRRR